MRWRAALKREQTARLDPGLINHLGGRGGYAQGLQMETRLCPNPVSPK